MASMTDDKVVAAVERAVEHIKEMAKQGERQIVPLLHVILSDGPGDGIIIRLTDVPEDHDDKVRLMQSAGQMLKGIGARPLMAIMVTEAWLSHNVGRRPSKDPKRVEVVVVSGLVRDGRQCACVYELRRRRDKTLVLVPHVGMPLAVVDPAAPPVDSVVLDDVLLSALMRATGAPL